MKCELSGMKEVRSVAISDNSHLEILLGTDK